MTDDTNVEVIHQWRWKSRFSSEWSDWMDGETPPIPAYGDEIDVRKVTIEYVDAAPQEEAGNAMYVVWSNEHRSWWRENGMGYTAQLEKAGIYSREKALKIVERSSSGWRLGGIPTEIAIPLDDAKYYIHPAARNID